jgi:acyl carrier protein
MTKQEIIEKTDAFLIGTLDIDQALITPDTELKRDIGITSVDAVAIASFTQKTFGCAIKMHDIKAIITLDELYDYIEKNI